MLCLVSVGTRAGLTAGSVACLLCHTEATGPSARRPSTRHPCLPAASGCSRCRRRRRCTAAAAVASRAGAATLLCPVLQGDTVPDFSAETTQGKMDSFHQFCGGQWTMLFR